MTMTIKRNHTLNIPYDKQQLTQYAYVRVCACAKKNRQSDSWDVMALMSS